MSTQQEVQEEVREPTGCIMRRNHLKIQIISDLANHVQRRSSLKTQRHNVLIFEIKPKHIDDAVQDDNWIKAMVVSADVHYVEAPKQYHFLQWLIQRPENNG